MVSHSVACRRSSRRIVLVGLAAALVVASQSLASAAKRPAARVAPEHGVTDSWPAGAVASASWSENQAAGGCYTLVGAAGGAARRVAVDGEIAYVAMGARLVPIDISNPDEPRILERGWLLAAVAEQLLLRDNVAFVLHHGGVQAIDLNQPGTRPGGGLASADSPLTYPSMAHHGGHIYVLGNSPDPLAAYLYVLDVSEPLAPADVAYRNLHASYGCRHPTIANGHLLFACQWPEDLQVFSLADPEEPVKAAEVHFESRVAGMVAEGDRLYVLSETELSVFDVTDPTQAYGLGSIEVGSGGSVLAVQGDRAALLMRGGAVHVIDVSDPAELRLIGSVEVPGASGDWTAEGLALAGERIAVGADWAGLVVAEVPDEGEVRVRGRVPTFEARSIAVENGTAYVLDGGSQLRVLGRTVSADWRLLEEIELPAAGVAIDSREGKVVALADSGDDAMLLSIDASDATAPELVGRLDLSARAEHVAFASKDLAVVSGGDIGLAVVDVGDSASPQLAAALEGEGWAAWRAAGETESYVADRRYGLRVVSLADPGNPAEIAALPYRYPGAIELEESQHRVYLVADIADRPSRLDRQRGFLRIDEPAPIMTAAPETRARVAVLDVSDPAAPFEIDVWRVEGGVPWPQDLQQIVALRDTVHVLYRWNYGGFWSSLAYYRAAQRLGDSALPAPRASDLRVLESGVYVANGSAGFLELAVPSAEPVPPTITPTPTGWRPTARSYLPLVTKSYRAR